jgi:hypothetical protein
MGSVEGKGRDAVKRAEFSSLGLVQTIEALP